MPNPPTRCQAEKDAQHDSSYGQQSSLPQNSGDDVALGRAHRLQDPNLPRALHHRRIHRLENHEKADDQAHADHDANEWTEARQIARRHHAQVVLHRSHIVILHPRLFFNGINHRSSIGRIIQLQIKNRCLSIRPNQILQRSYGNELARASSVFDNSANTELVIQYLHCVADIHMLLPCDEIVNEHVLRPAKRTALYITKRTAQRLEVRNIDPVNYFQSAAAANLPYDRTHHLHMRHTPQYIRHLNGHRRSRDPLEER